jgi:hypothetical protein
VAATYRALHGRAMRKASVRSSAHEKLRNRLTGFVIIVALVAAAVWGGAGGGVGALPITRLRKVGETKDGKPVYAPVS